MYFSAACAHVHAADARNGRRLWRFAPKYEDGLGTVLCRGPVNRGLGIKAT